jgi:hypothetical protein
MARSPRLPGTSVIGSIWAAIEPTQSRTRAVTAATPPSRWMLAHP